MRASRSVYRRRQATALAVLLALVVIAAVAIASGGDDADRDSGGRAAAAREKPPELPRGGRRIFPDYRVVGFYGAPQDEELGVLGIGPPRQAARKLER